MNSAMFFLSKEKENCFTVPTGDTIAEIAFTALCLAVEKVIRNGPLLTF